MPANGSRRGSSHNASRAARGALGLMALLLVCAPGPARAGEPLPLAIPEGILDALPWGLARREADAPPGLPSLRLPFGISLAPFAGSLLEGLHVHGLRQGPHDELGPRLGITWSLRF